MTNGTFGDSIMLGTLDTFLSYHSEWFGATHNRFSSFNNRRNVLLFLVFLRSMVSLTMSVVLRNSSNDMKKKVHCLMVFMIWVLWEMKKG